MPIKTSYFHDKKGRVKGSCYQNTHRKLQKKEQRISVWSPARLHTRGNSKRIQNLRLFVTLKVASTKVTTTATATASITILSFKIMG